MTDFIAYSPDVITNNQMSITISAVTAMDNNLQRGKILTECSFIIGLRCNTSKIDSTDIHIPITFHQNDTDVLIVLSNIKVPIDNIKTIDVFVLKDSNIDYIGELQLGIIESQNNTQCLILIPLIFYDNIEILSENNVFPDNCPLFLPYIDTSNNVLPVEKNTIYSVNNSGEQYIYTGEAWEKYSSSSTNTITSEETEELINELFNVLEEIII